MRSMTLIPVTRTSCEVFRSSNLGGSRWIGREPLRSSSPRPSIGSPVTFITRPLIWAPVGMVIGEPVVSTAIPLLRPSVESIAMVLTVSSPMCCSTSRVRAFPPGHSTLRASLMPGRSFEPSARSKCTSTTGPIIWEICPFIPDITLCYSYNFSLRGSQIY